MKDPLRQWADGLLSARPLALSRCVSVVGERDAHLGPRLEFAKVQLSVEPATQFEVVDTVPAKEELRSLGYPASVILGLLDVLMVALPAPVKNVRVVLEKVEYDPIDSSPMAFRLAGRAAGRRIVDAMTGVPVV